MAHPRLILGSASKGRLNLLKRIGITPDHIIGADIDETPFKNEKPRDYVRRMAIEKNQALAKDFSDDYLLTGDSTACVGRRILGKPEDAEEARGFFRLYSGRAHNLLSAVTLRAPDGRTTTRVNNTRITFKPLSDEEINKFIASEEWKGVAGGYRIQGRAQPLIQKIHGSHSSIVGLPLYETVQMLNGLGYPTP